MSRGTPRGGLHSDPAKIIQSQCKSPDKSVIELMFKNTSQFGSKEPLVFRVRFVAGRTALIDQKGFKENLANARSAGENFTARRFTRNPGLGRCFRDLYSRRSGGIPGVAATRWPMANDRLLEKTEGTPGTVGLYLARPVATPPVAIVSFSER